MKYQDVIILGSGQSILNLTNEEIEYINQCEVIIAINKFMAFYQKSKIIPNHVYYVDAYQKSIVLFLQFLFKICRKNNLKNLNFILGKTILHKPFNQQRLESNRLLYELKKIYLKLKKSTTEDLFLVPKKSKFEFIEHQVWLDENNYWSDSLEKPLFHFRGSLSTVLNYVSIKYPHRRIKLIGVDFNSPGYFFQEELEKLNFEWQDWTTAITKEKKMHFSAISYKGTNIFDKFNFILENLANSGNDIYVCNANSILATKGFVKYSSVTS